MRVTDKKPPVDLRCQIYVQLSPDASNGLIRCVNRGTHWEKWGGCSCPDPDDEVCEEDFYSWECDGVHDLTDAEAA